MTMPARVSAVIPAYNCAAYIADAVKSVLSQTRPPTEVIVVDDGSTDATARALEPFMDQICYVYQPNRGEPAARNRGVREATGQYIAFLDGDDLWLPNKLELQMQYFARNPECALVYTDMGTFHESGVVDASVKERFRMALPSGKIFRPLFMKSLFGSGSVVLRKECIERVGFFDEDFLVGCDYEMWLRVARNFEVGVVDQPLLMYRFHDEMATARGIARSLWKGVPWEVAVLSKILRLYPEAVSELGKSAVNRRMSRPYVRIALAHLRLHDHQSARSVFREAISLWPANLRYWTFYVATFLQPAQITTARKLYRQFSGQPAKPGAEETDTQAA